MPFKRHTGKQPFDSVNNTLVFPHLFGPKDDTDAFWVGYDWKRAVSVGMNAVGLPFSGEVGFVSTEYFFPITHMAQHNRKKRDADQGGQDAQGNFHRKGQPGHIVHQKQEQPAEQGHRGQEPAVVRPDQHGAWWLGRGSQDAFPRSCGLLAG